MSATEVVVNGSEKCSSRGPLEPKVVSREEWLVARKAHLVEEKALTRARDELHRKRRELPWVRIEKEYEFEGPDGKLKLSCLFRGRSQLIVQHFMLAPGWAEGCVGCSHLADHADGPRPHLEHHDVMFTAVSRAPWSQIEPFKKRMGWKFPWVSSFGSDFNYDFGVSFTPEQVASGNVPYNYGTTNYPMEELHGTSVFYKNEAGEVFHTYSTYARGAEILVGSYNFLDLTPKGRNEERNGRDWLKHHDRYEEGAPAADPVANPAVQKAGLPLAGGAPCCRGEGDA